ncbi:MAG: tetraspanin family protein [Clostridia bacterium]|nr:tetraspanin family protein [Clostridia bacterium]
MKEIIAKKSYFDIFLYLFFMIGGLVAVAVGLWLMLGLHDFDSGSYYDHQQLDVSVSLVVGGAIFFVVAIVFMVRQIKRKRILLTYEDGRLIFENGECVCPEEITEIKTDKGDIVVYYNGKTVKVSGAKDMQKVLVRLNALTKNTRQG